GVGLTEAAAHRSQTQLRQLQSAGELMGRVRSSLGDVRAAHSALARSTRTASDEVTRSRDDTRRLIRAGAEVSRGVQRLSREATTFEAEAGRFRLPQPRRGGVLRVVFPGFDFSSRETDPLLALGLWSSEAVGQVYAPLLRFEDGALRPELAEAFESDPASRSFRFALRRNLLFHDGTALTAVDVKRHFERLLDPKLASPHAWMLQSVEGADAFRAGTAPQVVGLDADGHTLEIRLLEPRPFLPQWLALPAAGIAKRDGQGGWVGAGPYRWGPSSSSSIRLEPNPTFHRSELPYLAAAELRSCPTAADAETLLRLGQVDLALGAWVHAGDGLQGLIGSAAGCAFLAFGFTDGPCRDPRVRRALRSGLDVQAWVDRYRPGAHVAQALTPPSLLDPEEGASPDAPDPELVRRLFREADVTGLRLEVFNQGDGGAEADAVLFRPLLEAGLVELRSVTLEPAEFQRRAGKGTLPLFHGHWFADYLDPDAFLYRLLHSGARTAAGPDYRNAEFDRLVEEARVAQDPELRHQLYRRAERQVRLDCPLIPLAHLSGSAIAKPGVQDLQLHATPPYLRLENLWVDS
ncbi:MAG TPA: ABC transporter substrate-binding protein, partial [Myxococcaceae bacterium]|nr:ABC transporter substrate-binding protein [Myxococcaceae bacterium]